MMNKSLLEKFTAITDEEQAFLNGNGDINRKIYTENGGNIINSNKLLNHGQLITFRPHTRFIHFPAHSHDYIEFIYVCSGNITQIINGNEIHLKEGELLFLSRNTQHEILPTKETDIALNFIILPRFFDNPLAMLNLEKSPLKSFIIDSLKEDSDNSSYMHFKVSEIIPVQNLIENLIMTLIGDTSNKQKISSYTMGLLFLQLMNCTDMIELETEQDHAIIDVLKYIDENYADGSLTDLSSKMHYDFCWLSREIKLQTGKTYTELVQEKRLMQACFLLTNTDLTIADIAIRTGYDNISFFHRLFKNRFNMSPRKYRLSQSE